MIVVWQAGVWKNNPPPPKSKNAPEKTPFDSQPLLIY